MNVSSEVVFVHGYVCSVEYVFASCLYPMLKAGLRQLLKTVMPWYKHVIQRTHGISSICSRLSI